MKVGFGKKYFTIDEIKIELNLIDLERKKINEKRKRWERETFSYIINFFEKASEQLNNKIVVEANRDIKNLNSIFITLADIKSGISRKEADGSKKEFEYFSGSLIYTQTLNGTITVWVAPPYVLDLMEQQTLKNIDSFHPSTVSDKKMTTHLYQFLEIVLEWEAQENIIGKVGYIQKDQEEN